MEIKTLKAKIKELEKDNEKWRQDSLFYLEKEKKDYALKDSLGLLAKTFHYQMLKKLKQKETDGWRGWNEPELFETIRQSFLKHADKLAKGDSNQSHDVANLAMMLNYQLGLRKFLESDSQKDSLKTNEKNTQSRELK